MNAGYMAFSKNIRRTSWDEKHIFLILILNGLKHLQ